MTNNIEKILKIQGIKIKNIKQTEKAIEIHFELEKKVHTCRTAIIKQNMFMIIEFRK